MLNDGGNGDFQCFSYFLAATFYFVKFNNLLLHVRTILFGFTHCDEWLWEFGLCVSSYLNSCGKGHHGWTIACS